MSHTGRSKRRRSLYMRLTVMLTLAMLAGAALLPAVVGAQQSPYSTISPQSPQAREIQDLYSLVFWLALIVFVGVQIGIVYTALTFRRKSEEDDRPEQVHGNRTLEITWTVIPAIVLLLIFIPTVRLMYAQADEVGAADYEIDIYGKQFWWEVHYSEPEEVAGVVTGNEIWLPQGHRVVFNLHTNNVIHSFWVPQLMGKMDLIPGHINRIAIDTENLGYYYGECAEFCGESHALMRFKVIVVPQEEFDQWIDGWRAGPTEASAEYVADGDVAQVPTAFGLCLACHQVEGTNAMIAPQGIAQAALTQDGGFFGPAKTAGPNLSLFGCRTTIAAGVLSNTPENLELWLTDPDSVKPGNYMSTVIEPGTLDQEQLDQLVGYLESLEPEGGCPEIPEQPGVEQQVEVTDQRNQR
jgi:cytochrome c oxidase subunit II